MTSFFVNSFYVHYQEIISKRYLTNRCEEDVTLKGFNIQEEISDLIRNLNLPKDYSELLCHETKGKEFYSTKHSRVPLFKSICKLIK